MAQIQRPPSAGSSPHRARHPLELRDTNAWLDKPLPIPQISTRTDSLKPSIRMHNAPASPISINPPCTVGQPESAQISAGSPPASIISHSRRSSQEATSPDMYIRDSISNLSLKERSHSVDSQPPRASSRHSIKSSASSQPYLDNVPEDPASYTAQGLQYHHQPYGGDSPGPRVQRASQMTFQSTSSTSSIENGNHLRPPRTGSARPHSTATLGDPRGRHGDDSPRGTPRSYARNSSAARLSPDNRPMSYIDLLNEVPYHQQVAPVPVLNNVLLQNAVGANASLLDTKKTLDMYRANVKKTNDPAIQYEFAMLMINTARDSMATGETIGGGQGTAQDMIKESREILARLSDRGYPFAQYYLADGYASGFFNKDKPDNDRAFPLFIAASKHGHAEASYRAALCYEFGWGSAKSYPKAVQFLRAAAAKGHPGAAVRLGKACLHSDMGLTNRYREGVKWLKRAQEGADAQYNAGPYELGLLHINGWGDDIFKDESYAAQLFTQSAELGHPEANQRMGQAYELGLLGCPRDAALSVHFYNGAATAGSPTAMLALCAWYMVGAEPVLEKDECEAYEWAKRAAELGLDKAEYAVAYFTEMGIGCRRDPLEANMWYVRAAEQGNESAKQRLAIIRAAAAGETLAPVPMEKALPRTRELASNNNKGSGGAVSGKEKEKDCIVM